MSRQVVFGTQSQTQIACGLGTSKPSPTFKPQVGFEASFDVECDGITFRHQWRVTEVETNKCISYSWNYADFAGNSRVTWLITESESGTRLKLTHECTEDFSIDVDVFSRENGVAGWEYLVNDSLKSHLLGN